MRRAFNPSSVEGLNNSNEVLHVMGTWNLEWPLLKEVGEHILDTLQVQYRMTRHLLVGVLCRKKSNSQHGGFPVPIGRGIAPTEPTITLPGSH